MPNETPESECLCGANYQEEGCEWHNNPPDTCPHLGVGTDAWRNRWPQTIRHVIPHVNGITEEYIGGARHIYPPKK